MPLTSGHGLKYILEKVAVRPLHAFSGLLRHQLLKLFTEALKLAELFETQRFALPRHKEKQQLRQSFSGHLVESLMKAFLDNGHIGPIQLPFARILFLQTLMALKLG